MYLLIIKIYCKQVKMNIEFKQKQRISSRYQQVPSDFFVIEKRYLNRRCICFQLSFQDSNSKVARAYPACLLE